MMIINHKMVVRKESVTRSFEHENKQSTLLHEYIIRKDSKEPIHLLSISMSVLS